MLKYLLIYITIFLGCDNKIYKENKLNSDLNCLKITTLEENDLQIAEQFFNIDQNSCEYNLLIEPYFAHNCNNPVIKSVGSDFDGYVSLKIFQNNQLVFKSQTDFKGDDYTNHLIRLLKDLSQEKELQDILK